MPILISETDVRLEKTDLLNRIVLPRQVDEQGRIIPPSRTPGLHLSGLIKYISEKTKIQTYVKDATEEDAIEKGLMPLRWALGHAWEEFAASLYPDMLWQPFEVTNPVVMTCDGLSIDEGVIEEFKFSRGKYIEGANLVKNKWAWMQQGMGYCLGYGFRRVRWNVFAAMNWPDPKYTRYLVEFSEREIGQMANVIEVNKDKAIEEGYAE